MATDLCPRCLIGDVCDVKDIISTPTGCGNYVERQKTNFDHVRELSIVELARWRANGQCPPIHFVNDYECQDMSCAECWLKWLMENEKEDESLD